MYVWSVTPLWAHYAAASVAFVGVALSILRWLLFRECPSLYLPPHRMTIVHHTVNVDPYHCATLLTSGRWLDSDALNWQPDGCMLHKYTPQDVESCMAHTSVVFVGDSIVRNLFFALANTADPSLPASAPQDSRKHVDYHFDTQSGVAFSFYWDPYLNSSRTLTFDFNNPYLLVLGTGLWHLRYQDSSGGLAAWEARIESLIDSVSQNIRQSVPSTAVFLPVQRVVPSKLSPERGATLTHSDIDAMNADLGQRINPFLTGNFLPHTTSQILLPTVLNDILLPSQTADGLHYSSNVLKAQANVLYNRICNDILQKHYPIDKTCCRRYPAPPLLQLVVLCIITAVGPVAFILSRQSASWAPFIPSSNRCIHLTCFGLTIGLLYISDRTHVVLKEQKQYSPLQFGVLIIIIFATGIYTWKKKDKEQQFLNRDQTDEWKGWMQCLYHLFVDPFV